MVAIHARKVDPAKKIKKDQSHGCYTIYTTTEQNSREVCGSLIPLYFQ